MKLKVKAEKLEYKRFNEHLTTMRHWPEYQRSVAHDILKHVQYLNEQIELLEKDIRQIREISFLEEKTKIQQRAAILDTNPELSPSLKKISEKIYTPRGERFYYLLESGGYKNYLKLQDAMTKELMIEIANEWADMTNKPKINV